MFRLEHRRFTYGKLPEKSDERALVLDLERPVRGVHAGIVSHLAQLDDSNDIVFEVSMRKVREAKCRHSAKS